MFQALYNIPENTFEEFLEPAELHSLSLTASITREGVLASDFRAKVKFILEHKNSCKELPLRCIIRDTSYAKEALYPVMLHMRKYGAIDLETMILIKAEMDNISHDDIVELRANEPSHNHSFVIEDGVCTNIKAINDCIIGSQTYGEDTVYNTYRCYPNNGTKESIIVRHLIQIKEENEAKSYDAKLFKEYGEPSHPLRWMAE
jgi:hypothetical protein